MARPNQSRARGGEGLAERPAPQQARSRRTRRRLLEAAVACFETHGYDATTTTAIARRAGVAVGTLYGHFPDKRAIVLELLDGTVREIADLVVRGLELDSWSDGDPRARVRELIDAVFHARSITPGLQRILWQRYFTDDRVRDAVQAIEHRVRDALEATLGALRDAGRLRIHDVESAALVIYTSVEWTAARLLLEKSDADTEPAAASAADMITRFLFE